MSKYFQEPSQDIISLSEYALRLKEQDRQHDYETTMNIHNYVLDKLGDIVLPDSMIKTFYDNLRFTGKYSVKGEVETLKGLTKIIEEIPSLSPDGFSELSYYYISDLFEKYDLINVLKKLTHTFGETDSTFEEFLGYVSRKSEELDNEYTKESKQLDKYQREYSIKYIEYLKSLIKYRHIPLEKIESAMPESKIISQDEQQLLDLSYKTRIYMGVGYPVSYEMTKKIATDKDLTIYGDQPGYYVNGQRYEDTTFTTKEFIDSVTKTNKAKQLIKKEGSD